MAFRADCDVSTVLVALRVASTPRFPVPVATRGRYDEALRDSATPTVGSRRRIQAWGRQIRNSKFEIRNFWGGLYRLKKPVEPLPPPSCICWLSSRMRSLRALIFCCASSRARWTSERASSTSRLNSSELPEDSWI